MEAKHAVKVTNLRLALGKGANARPVLRGVDFKARRGSIHMLLGPNGCGKSTFLKVLGGILRPDQGRVVADQPTGFVFQNPDHQVVLPTVASDVAFGLGRYKLDKADVEESVEYALGLVNLLDYKFRPSHTLSGGQKQRVAIAGALAEDAKVLLLDELTTFLDVEDQFGVLKAVRNVTQRDGNVTAIWVTHRFEELDYADRASYMEDGAIRFSGTAAEMRSHLSKLGADV